MRFPGVQALGKRGPRYVVVGGISFLIDYALTWTFLQVLPLLLANTLGFLCANIANFVLAHSWVFGRAFEREGLLRAWLSVLGVSVVGLVISDVVVWLAVVVLQWSLLWAKVLATAIGLLWNFLARLRWVYQDR